MIVKGKKEKKKLVCIPLHIKLDKTTADDDIFVLKRAEQIVLKRADQWSVSVKLNTAYGFKRKRIKKNVTGVYTIAN